MSNVDFKPVTLIEPTTSAVTTVVPYAVDQRFLPGSIFAPDLAGSEAVQVLYSIDNGENFVAAQEGGSAVTLTETNNEQIILGPVLLGVTKDATVSAVGVFVMTNKQAKQQ